MPMVVIFLFLAVAEEKLLYLKRNKSAHWTIQQKIYSPLDLIWIAEKCLRAAVRQNPTGFRILWPFDTSYFGLPWLLYEVIWSRICGLCIQTYLTPEEEEEKRDEPRMTKKSLLFLTLLVSKWVEKNRSASLMIRNWETILHFTIYKLYWRGRRIPVKF